MLLHSPARSAVSAAPTLSLTVVADVRAGYGAGCAPIYAGNGGSGVWHRHDCRQHHDARCGSLAIAPFIPRISMALGPKRAVTLALLTGAATLALFPLLPSIWVWFGLRTVLGAACEIILVLSESWLNQITPDHARGRVMGLYSTLLSIGIAAGPALLTVTGRTSALPFACASVALLVTTGLVAAPWLPHPQLTPPQRPSLLRYLPLAPIVIAATLLIAMLDSAATSFLALYAMHSGWSEHAATLLLSIMLLGATAFQIPIGWIGDRTSRRWLLVSLAGLAAGGALLWPVAIHHPGLAHVLLFAWDGVFASIYTVAMSVVGDRYKGGDLIAIYTLSSLAWGAGAFVGPALAASSMAAAPDGLAWFAAITCALFGLLPLFLKKALKRCLLRPGRRLGCSPANGRANPPRT